VASKKSSSRKKRGRREKKNPFGDLSWDDLEHWAGHRILDRGRRYHSTGAVRDLGRTDETIMAWVRGSHRYATRVTLQEPGTLSSDCSCPYFSTCKHAVAVVLTYLDRLNSGEAVPPLDDDDPRLAALEDLQEGFDEEGEYEDEIIEREAVGPKTHRFRGPSALLSWLQRLTKSELVDLLAEIVSERPEVLPLLEHRQRLASGKPGKILASVRRVIQELKEPLWDYDGHGYWQSGVDFGRLQEQLAALVKAGQADVLAGLGLELLEGAVRTVESEHEGESSHALGVCLGVVFRAVSRSSLSEAEQIVWVVDMVLADDYSLCDEGLAAFWEQTYAQDAWKAVAERLAQRMDTLPAPVEDNGVGVCFRRDRLANWTITALEHAGLEDRIIPLCEREAPVTWSYERLVERLLAAKRLAEAERWCTRGISETPRWPGLLSNLRRLMLVIAEQQGDPLRVVALQAETFFDRPSLETFQTLGQAAEEAGVDRQVDAWARHYLVAGRTPPGVRGRPRRKRKDDPGLPWPLPDPRVPMVSCGNSPSAPMTDVLLQLAIEEERADEIVRWYDHSRRSGSPGWFAARDVEVARALEKTHPERAVAIYKKLAEAHIATVTRRGYEAAGGFLRKIKRVLRGNGGSEQWSSYLAVLRKQNVRRPRCIEVLDRVASGDRPIISRQ
jgi:uncharacterized Zn finger protein